MAWKKKHEIANEENKITKKKTLAQQNNKQYVRTYIRTDQAISRRPQRKLEIIELPLEKKTYTPGPGTK